MDRRRFLELMIRMNEVFGYGPINDTKVEEYYEALKVTDERSLERAYQELRRVRVERGLPTPAEILETILLLPEEPAAPTNAPQLAAPAPHERLTQEQTSMMMALLAQRMSGEITQDVLETEIAKMRDGLGLPA